MTPREKWRAKAKAWLKDQGWRESMLEVSSDATLYNKVRSALQDATEAANYLTCEYLINVKTSDYEKGTEISDKK